MVEFAKLTDAETTAVQTIARRAVQKFKEAGVRTLRQTDIVMDLSAVHAKCPLRLEELAACETFDFMHDVAGINRHLNRESGELEGCFLPRFAVPVYELPVQEERPDLLSGDIVYSLRGHDGSVTLSREGVFSDTRTVDAAGAGVTLALARHHDGRVTVTTVGAGQAAGHAPENGFPDLSEAARWLILNAL